MADSDALADKFVDRLLGETKGIMATRKGAEVSNPPEALAHVLEGVDTEVTKNILGDSDSVRAVGRFLRHSLRGEL